ncbi:MAG: PHP domain-containing protein [Chloroflexi bacterium]|nr:PHP domain-containing protein [Chloroflexota bacterium]
MGFADLHIHSMYSYDGTASISAILKYATDFTRLNVLAITDHDSMQGVPEALDLAPKYNLEVIPGCEISSIDGHVLALFIDRPISAGLSLFETVMRVGERGGLCIAAHPMAKGVDSLSFEMIRSVLHHPEAAKILVGVEAFNGGLVYTRRNQAVADECQQLPMSHVGNSDAHILPMIGEGSSLFIGHSALDLRRALENYSTIPLQGKGLSGTSVLISYIPRFVLRKLGWVSWNASPDKKLGYARLSHILSEGSLPQFSQS